MTSGDLLVPELRKHDATGGHKPAVPVLGRVEGLDVGADHKSGLCRDGAGDLVDQKAVVGHGGRARRSLS